MIVGIGSDILEISRMEQALARRGEPLAWRLLAPEEWQDWENAAEPGRMLAKRFAAKEAVLKALGTGLREGIRWSQIRISHDRRGKPEVRVREQAEAVMKRQGGTRIWLSLSDERHYVVAFAIVEKP